MFSDINNPHRIKLPARKNRNTAATAAVAAAVKGERVALAASNATFGDPTPGVPKKLHVDYRVGAQKLSCEVGEGGQLAIAAPTGQKLAIIKAVYGPADGSTPVSAAAITEDPGAVLDVLACAERREDRWDGRWQPFCSALTSI